jgi:hypothetical protein
MFIYWDACWCRAADTAQKNLELASVCQVGDIYTHLFLHGASYVYRVHLTRGYVK